MKALSIKQPWALVISMGVKTIETRTWPTNYRGDILIVSSKTLDEDMIRLLRTEIGVFGVARLEARLEYGKAIAIANLVDCRPMTEDDENAAMCDIFPGAYSWVLDDIRRIKPFPVKGRLGLYDVECADDELCLSFKGSIYG